MSEQTKPTFKERLQSSAPGGPFGASDELWRYREAAAVLETFDRDTLQPVGDAPSDKSVRTALLADCDVSYDAERQPRWALRTNVRQGALRRLVETGRVQIALDSNPNRLRTPTQDIFERLLTEQGIQFESSQLIGFDSALLKVIRWLEGVPELRENLPSASWVRSLLSRQQLMQPFRTLVGPSFAGRRPELDALSDYVGWYAAHSLTESMTRGFEYVFDIQKRPPLFISGPGGSGKSTLIAKFILDHVDTAEGTAFPFCYLDFDRPGLVAEEPITLLTEMLRQIAIQFPDSTDQAAALGDRWTARTVESIRIEANPQSAKNSLRFRLRERQSFLSEFSSYIDGLKSSDQPLMLVVDTFEEVQFRSATYAEELFHFLNQLQAVVPKLRTVLCGRVEFKSGLFPIKSVVIDDFDQEAAVSYLRVRGVEDSAVARKIYEQVGGSPLVLKLASDVARLEKTGKTGLKDLPSSWLSLFTEKSIEVVLYKRILSHIVDSRVKELAFPGLVLRRLTPEIILEVLAPACDVGVRSLQDASVILDTMRAQLNTILIQSPSDQETLIHRTDMRWILLSDVKAKAAKDASLRRKVEKSFELAVEYCRQFDDPERRAEEILYRLQLGIDRHMLAARWISGLGSFLASGIKELPELSQIYLAARIQVELPKKLWDKAPDEDWLLYAKRNAIQCLEVGDPQAAFAVLRKRAELWTNEVLATVFRQVVDALFQRYGVRYEKIREDLPAGGNRTMKMGRLVEEIQELTSQLSLEGTYPSALFDQGTDGERLVALAMAKRIPEADHLALAVKAIENSRSPFEQYHGLWLAYMFFEEASLIERQQLRAALIEQHGVPIHQSDPSRWRMRQDLLSRLDKEMSNYYTKK